MARYVIMSRLMGKAKSPAGMASLRAMDRAIKKHPAVKIVEQKEGAEGTGRRRTVVECEDAAMRVMKKALPKDVIVEPVIKFRPHGSSPHTAPANAISATVRGGAAPLPAARLTLLCAAASGLNPLTPSLTDAQGKAAVGYDDTDNPAFVLGEPAGGHWGVYSGFNGNAYDFDCPALPAGGPFGWWHQVLGVTAYDPKRGHGIRIGVVGTGVGPHPCLNHVKRIDRRMDAGRHETHVAGILGARPVSPGEYAGIVPGAEIFSACFYKPAPGADVEPEDQGVLVSKIEQLVRSQAAGGYGVHLLNLSFGASQDSKLLHDAIKFAIQQGVLCICSAGNNMGGALDYPAAYAEAVAVSALGKKGWGPAGTITSYWEPQGAQYHGKKGLYLASMSSTGKGITCAAPGSGIVSTFPATGGLTAPYAPMDGTSMASPMACGVLAALLSGMRDYLAMPRTALRAKKARAVLLKHCVDIGLAADYQGKGVPSIA